MTVVRMNFGCGSVQPDGWVNVDCDSDFFDEDYLLAHSDYPGRPEPGPWYGDPRSGFPDDWTDAFDYIVANHSLSDWTFHELPGALSELHRVLRPGGVLRVLVPDLIGAVEAWRTMNKGWFPQGDDLTSIEERFCTFVTWFGTVGSVFTQAYLKLLLERAGFSVQGRFRLDETLEGPPEITSLDGDRTTSLIMEGVK